MSIDYLDVKALARELDDLRERLDEAEDEGGLDKEEEDRLAALVQLESDIGGDLHLAARDYVLHNDRDWEEYARERAEELHPEVLRNPGWPFDCIDWEQAAQDLHPDYYSVEFDGETYWRPA